MLYIYIPRNPCGLFFIRDGFTRNGLFLVQMRIWVLIVSGSSICMTARVPTSSDGL